jgi:predicted amidohydrolase
VTLRVAAGHGPLAPRRGTPAEGLAAVRALAARATAQGARLLVLPQLSLTGWADDEAAADRVAQPSDGPLPRRLAELAREHSLAILGGYLERCTGRCHDAALFVDERGCALANYRRTHLVPGRDPPVLSPGQWLTVVPFGGRKLGLLIGADVEAPEPARALALAGADTLLVAARHGAAMAAAGGALLAARAFENGRAVVYANGAAEPGAPASRVVGPDGAVLAEAEAAAGALAVADLPAAPAADADPRLAGRRPRLYRRLAAETPGEDAPRL